MIWNLGVPIVRRKLNKKYTYSFHEENPEPEEGFLLLGNHVHHADAFLMALNLKQPVSFMADREAASFSSYMGGLLTGTIFRSLGTEDMKAIRKAHTLINRGHSVGIFPEGRRSWDGRGRSDLHKTARLAKLFHAPLRLVRVEGLYLNQPRWAAQARQVPVDLYFKTITLNELDTLSVSELSEVLAPYLLHDEIKAAAGRRVEGDAFAEGVENLLWLCPACHSMDSLKGEGNRIVCQNCGAGSLLNGNLQLSGSPFADLGEWNEWQGNHKFEKKEILLSFEAELSSKREPALSTGKGELILQDGMLLFRIENRTMRFPLHELHSYNVLFNSQFYFTYGTKRFCLRTADKSLYKLLQICDALPR